MAKHKAKVLTETNRLLGILKPKPAIQGENGFATGLRNTANQIVHRFRQKLIAVAVGRRAIHPELGVAMPKCWAIGFKMAHGRKTPLNELKELDRFRERQIARVARRLEGLPLVKVPAKTSRVRPPRYHGFPFSYVGEFLAARKSKG